ncbi:hypothetical protein RRG08_009628 [Elysia crispata]|uniref:Uncharacterized protein n=1 Tax=Elysia crispata TaxID=231223 RepID=A0AAE0XU96_9GAST|nr:hypothetical protein RRG08_009628 [Elysia crispata]
MPYLARTERTFKDFCSCQPRRQRSSDTLCLELSWLDQPQPRRQRSSDTLCLELVRPAPAPRRQRSSDTLCLELVRPAPAPEAEE